MGWGRIIRGRKSKKQVRQASKDLAVGVAKELVLVRPYGVKKITVADLHYDKPKKGKRPWEKKWGEC